MKGTWRTRSLFNNVSTPNTPTGFVYDYFIKDHLGNVRMVLTDEAKQDIYPAATLEGSLTTGGSPNAAYIEKNYYTINSANVVASTTATGISTYQNHNGNPPVNNNPNSVVTANSAKLYKLKSTSTQGVTGLGITLKVMAGDKIDIFGKSYYFTNNTGGTSLNKAIPVLDILTGLLGGPTGGAAAAAHDGVTASQLNGIGTVTSGINTLFSAQTTDIAGAPQVPKAYINYIFFDEQFKVAGSGFSRVGSNSVVKTHSDLTNKTAPKNGFVYIYVSNESPVDVFFDNLQVIHTRGQILEETHYYPFGLTMAGISSKALNNAPTNRFKYNDGSELANQEFSDGSGLDWYATTYRSYDAQIGRFHQIDPLAGIADDYSPYAYVLNNPLLYNDPYGLDTTRGNAPKPNPDPGDVWIPGKGPDQIFDADQGWTPNPVLQEVVVGGGSSNNDNSNNTSAPSWWPTTYQVASAMVGTVGSYYGFKGYTTHNEWWWKQKNGTWRWRTNATKSNYLFNRSYKLKGNALTKAKALSTKLAIVNAGLIITDVAVNKQIKASHVINGLMTGLSFTGVGSIISGVWFIADMGTQFVTGKSLSDRLDEAVGEPLVDWNDKKDD